MTTFAHITTAFYDAQAAEYAESSCGKSLAECIDPFVQVLPADGVILDLGSGAGRDSLEFERRGYAVVSLDRSPGLLREHRRRGGSWLIEGDMTGLPFPNHRFHGVWACASLLHIPKDLVQGVLAEVHRVLYPGGAFFSAIKLGDGEGSHLSAVGDTPAASEPARYWAFYRREEWLEHITRAGFSPLWSHVSQDAAGRPISWLNLLATR